MLLVRCDRCQIIKEIEPLITFRMDEDRIGFDYPPEWTRFSDRDICKDCQIKFRNWIASEKKSVVGS